MPQVLELGLLEGRVQQWLVVQLELDPALGEAVERRPCERRGALQRGQSPLVGGARRS